MAYNGGNVIFGSNLWGNIVGKGTISNDSLKIDNVEHVDNLGFNLLSIGQICDNKCRIIFSEHDSEITKDGKVIGRGIRKKGLYVMKLGNKPKDQICLAMIDENSTLWHRRLGHANMRLIQSLTSKELVRNLPKLKFDQHFYDVCKIGKQAYASHKAKNVVTTTRCLELLYIDLFDPSAVQSYGGNRYTLVILDDHFRYTWTRFLKDKTEAFDQFEIFSRKIQNQLVPQPKNMTIIVTKWVFRNKLDENGIVFRNKARLVVQGYNQQEGIDYDEIYAPVARLKSIIILLAYACALDFKLFQMNVKSAFLNGFINKEVYVAQPSGFIDIEKADHVYKLKKALYGLKQAPKAWYDRLKAFLIKHEYKMGMVDNILFTKKKCSNLIIVQIYVDDIIFGSTCQDICDEFAKIMHDEFEMSMMGELNFFLGLQIKQMEDSIFFNQSKYIKEMLKKFGLKDSKPMKTPMSSDTKITKDEECELIDSTQVSRHDRIPCEGACVFSHRWSLNELVYGAPSKGPYQTNLPSLDDIISYIREDREGQVTRIRHQEEVEVQDYQFLTREIMSTLKPLKEIIQENVFCLGGKRDHVPACLCYMLYCVANSEKFNLAYFMAKQMEWVTKQARLILPFGMLLTCLFDFIIDENLKLQNESYVLYDRVMNPLVAQLERKPRRDRGTTRGCNSTSSLTFNQPSSSHLNDDDDDDDGNNEGTSSASTPSHIRVLRCVLPRRRFRGCVLLPRSDKTGHCVLVMLFRGCVLLPRSNKTGHCVLVLLLLLRFGLCVLLIEDNLAF
nr:retrovirus-related Pol polyprotein from transposon TNT 1-94 [Tanacetum cinerariifolium]